MWYRRMKEILVYIVSVLILLVIFELFCADMKTSKFIKFAFSSIIAFLFATNILKSIQKLTQEDSFVFTEQSVEDSLMYNQVLNLEKIIETRIKLEQDILSDVSISYSNNEGVVDYDLIEVYAMGVTEEKKKIIESLVAEYLDCPVVVYV